MKTCDTKEKLLKTAFELIWAESFGSVGVDEICRRAGVQKGSFYHFFPSKVDLAVEALESRWQEYKPALDEIFSSAVPPLQKLFDFCDLAVKKQRDLRKQFGFVPGCPYTAIGSEQGTRQKKLRAKVAEMFNHNKRYFEAAIREACERGDIPAADPEAKADELLSYYLGVLTRARIADDLRLLKGLKGAFRALLGVREEAAV